ncbi:AAA family ATPase [Candidatus Kaiserbacteria bacterium]|nr:AAA family ATPase [Candidatus Kaiserbacteria bacterium]
MKLVIIFGPQAVGKMTIGHELEKISDLKLFHNHMTIELVQPFFNYGTTEGKRLVKLFRNEIFKAVADSDQEGLIFTMIWSFNEKGDWDYIKEISEIFSSKGGEICFVELEADAEVRIERNKTEHRLAHKPTKRDIEWSEGELLNSLDKHRLNSKEGEIESQNYIRINNNDLSPEEVAVKIKERFNL